MNEGEERKKEREEKQCGQNDKESLKTSEYQALPSQNNLQHSLPLMNQV